MTLRAAFACASVCLAALVGCAVAASGSGVPEQVHLSLTHDVSEEAVMFAIMGANSLHEDGSVFVEYGTSSGAMTDKVMATGYTYSTGGTEWPGTLYRAVMTGLAPSTKYYYRCVAPGGPTDVFAFTSAPDKVTYPTVFATYGDLGEKCNTPGCGDATMAALQAATARDEFNLVVHVGDIAYTSGTQSIWDNFFNQMQPVTANVSYMTIPGNHEHYFNFTGYRNRFYMPGEVDGTINNLWNSFDYAGVHFIGYSTEHNYYPGSWQLRWIEEDLKKAAANRANVPWIVMYGHRPCYCSTDDYYDCNIVGPYKLRRYIEPLMHKYGVDLGIAGHLHNYERTAVVLNGTVLSKTYNNPAATVHVVAGMAGDDEGLTNKWENPQPDWSLVRTAQLGYGRVTVQDAHTLTWDFILAETGEVFDSFTIKK